MNTKYLKQFIHSEIFSENENDLAIISTYLERQVKTGEKMKIVYGETYDEYGLTIDSLKYYFILHIFKELLGNKVTCELIVGDTASLRNKMTAKQKEETVRQIANNNRKIAELFTRFQLDIQKQKMSDLFMEKEYKVRFKEVTKLYRSNKKVKELFEKTVLDNRIKQETDSDFLYSREEVSLIVDYDFKIGPPREKYYDQVASKYKTMNNNEFCSLYVKPTYPIGFNFDYFISNPEIEEYGLTPYKAGSNKLQDNRIILQNYNLKDLERLISKTYYSQDSELPNPLLDLYIIGDLAKKIDKKDYDFKKYSLSNISKEEILPLLNKYIFSKL